MSRYNNILLYKVQTQNSAVQLLELRGERKANDGWKGRKWRSEMKSRVNEIRMNKEREKKGNVEESKGKGARGVYEGRELGLKGRCTCRQVKMEWGRRWNIYMLYY